MKRDKNFEVPFAVMRQIGTSMEDQLVSGFTRVIRSGLYADGMTLPGVRKLAMLFGVSEITVRNAVKRLCRDGLLAARPRVGLTVCASGGRSWRGVVLGVNAGPAGSYNVNVIEGVLGNVLRRNGWLYSSVKMDSDSPDADFPMLDMMLDASVSLAVTFEAPPAISTRIARSGVRFVEVRPHRPSDKAAFVVRDDLTAALSELAVALKSAGVRTVLSVYQHPAVSSMYSSELEKTGLKVRSQRIRPIGGHNTQECVQRAGLESFEKLLRCGRIREDAVVCNDDYLAAGILSAFDRLGVRIPEDVRFATLANVGLGPVHAKDLARIENDPVRIGEIAGRAIVDYLESGKVPEVCDVPCRFVRGETVAWT